MKNVAKLVFLTFVGLSTCAVAELLPPAGQIPGAPMGRPGGLVTPPYTGPAGGAGSAFNTGFHGVPAPVGGGFASSYRYSYSYLRISYSSVRYRSVAFRPCPPRVYRPCYVRRVAVRRPCGFGIFGRRYY
jgi:hypothetical protein